MPLVAMGVVAKAWKNGANIISSAKTIWICGEKNVRPLRMHAPARGRGHFETGRGVNTREILLQPATMRKEYPNNVNSGASLKVSSPGFPRNF
jgi:hypothetical protein